MIIRKESSLRTLFGRPDRKIDHNAPELRFMESVCKGDVDTALSLFCEEKLFGGKPVVDVPYGRFEGLSEIKDFARGWLAMFDAVHAEIDPVIQTRAAGRSVTESIVNFEVDGAINQVSMFIVGDLRTQNLLDEVRVYFHFTHCPGLTPYRKPLFVSAHKEVGDPDLLTGAVKEYYAALHHVPHVDVDRIMKSMGDPCPFGGYEPDGSAAHIACTRQELREKYEHMATYIPRWVGMRYETIIDDGVNCIIEWVHVVSDAGRKEASRVAISGISAYERGEDGLLCGIRICDYAGYEKDIDWSKTPVSKEEAFKINAVSVFPDSVGCKKL